MADSGVKGRGEAAPFSALTLGKNAGVEKQDVRSLGEGSCADDEDQVGGLDEAAPNSAPASRGDESVEKRKEIAGGREGAAPRAAG